jgi:hypothetical protein
MSDYSFVRVCILRFATRPGASSSFIRPSVYRHKCKAGLNKSSKSLGASNFTYSALYPEASQLWSDL